MVPGSFGREGTLSSCGKAKLVNPNMSAGSLRWRRIPGLASSRRGTVGGGGGEPRMQKEVRTLNHVYSGTNRGPLLLPSSLPLRQKFARASALNPRPPPILQSPCCGGGVEGSFTSICFCPCPPLQQNSCAGVSVFLCFFFFFFFFRGGAGGAGNRGSLRLNIPEQGKQF